MQALFYHLLLQAKSEFKLGNLIKVYFRHVGVRAEFQKVVNVQHINNFSPFLPSLP